jgi:hypothetical protein
MDICVVYPKQLIKILPAGESGRLRKNAPSHGALVSGGYRNDAVTSAGDEYEPAWRHAQN